MLPAKMGPLLYETVQPGRNMIPAVVIGLNTARFAPLEADLAALGISAQFWQASSGSTPELGCYESHRSVWQHVVSTNVSTLIFEDDVAVRVGAAEFGRVHLAAESLDAVLYGYCQSSRVKTKRIVGSLYEYGASSCTHAYWLTPYAASCLLAYPSVVRPGRLLADDATRYVFGRLRAGMVSPPFFFQDVWAYRSALRSDRSSQRSVALFFEHPVCEWVQEILFLGSLLVLSAGFFVCVAISPVRSHFGAWCYGRAAEH